MAIIITLILVGAVLLFLETILPGMVAGAVGFLCLAAAVIVGYRELSFQAANMLLLGIVAGFGCGVYCWLRFFPESRMAKKFISHAAVGELGVDRPELLHGTGEALTQLRPSGTAKINGQRVDVVTEGGMIERGTPVKVVAVEGTRIVVRAI